MIWTDLISRMVATPRQVEPARRNHRSRATELEILRAVEDLEEATVNQVAEMMPDLSVKYVNIVLNRLTESCELILRREARLKIWRLP